LSVATQVIHPVSRDQDRACVPYRSAWSACSLVYAPQMLLHIRRRSSRSILPILTLQGITPIHTRAPTRYFRLYLYPIPSLILPCWRRVWFSAYSSSQDTFTPPSPNLALVGVSGRKGRAALHHKPHLHGCGFITSTISSTIPPSLPSASANRAVCDLLSSLPRPDTDKETTHLARESVSDGCDGLHSLLRLMEFV
jgi:hypothetical protein